MLQQAMIAKEKVVPAGSPKLLGYYYFLGQLEQDKGAYADAIALAKEGAATCDRTYGAGSACAVILEYLLGTALASAGNNAAAETTLRDAVERCNADLRDGRAGQRPAAERIERCPSEHRQIRRSGEHPQQGAGPEPSADRVGQRQRRPSVTTIWRSCTGRPGDTKKRKTRSARPLAVDQKALGADNPVTVINTLVLSQILRVEKQYPEAEKLARSGLGQCAADLRHGATGSSGMDLALVGLGDILVDTNRYAEAEPLYVQAMDHVVKYLGPDHAGVGRHRAEPGEAATCHRARQGSPRRPAARLHHLARSDFQVLAWRAPAELMAFYASGPNANRALAIYYGKEAVNDLQRLRGNLAGSAEIQTAFVGANEVVTVYRTLANLLLADSRFSEAQQVRAMVKGAGAVRFQHSHGGK